jgi:hypothetical protein
MAADKVSVSEDPTSLRDITGVQTDVSVYLGDCDGDTLSVVRRNIGGNGRLDMEASRRCA